MGVRELDLQGEAVKEGSAGREGFSYLHDVCALDVEDLILNDKKKTRVVEFVASCRRIYHRYIWKKYYQEKRSKFDEHNFVETR